MAGIGFRLREMATRKTFSEWLKLYTYSAVIFSGPWLISIMALAALAVFVLPSMMEFEVRIFTVIIVYIYCFSLITTGTIQLVVTRYVSDQFYMKNPEAVVPTFVGSIFVTVLVQTATGAIALYFADLDLLYKIAALGLYVTVSVVWIEMLFLSAAKDYTNIVLSFAIGYLSSFLCARALGIWFGLDGLAIGFLIGQVALVVLLMYRIFSEYRFGRGFNFAFLGHIKKYPSLVVAGVAYNAAIWVDKIIFWYSPSGLHVHSIFYTHFPYDSAMFLAYVTIIPTIAIFMLRIETDFYMKYKSYYGCILQKAPLGRILKRKEEMIDVLRDAWKTATIYQGVISLGSFILMPWIVALLGIDPAMTPVFRVAIVGAFFHAGLVILLILLLYFDFRGSAMFMSLVFLLSNTAFTLVTTMMPMWTMGFGYMASCLLTLVVGYVVLAQRIKNLEYLTFMRQPLR
ncbi:MAG: exopolysaccharide Pel transporter PelG [Deltaproteobacteria bacterium]|nr:exopolysaccharide Pel transporter PelG [Deltaproteobacteria bacterium]